MPTDNLEVQLRTDFRYFLTAIWTHLKLPPPTRAQLCIAEYLQTGPKRLQIQAFRGVGKSWITAAFVLWTLFNDPDKKIMVVSASKDRADSFSIFCQRLIMEVTWLAHLKPKSDDQRWSRVSFDVGPAKPHQAPSVKSVGITGQLTGSRADLMILDDVEVPGNSMTELMREKLLQLCTETESILTPKPDSRIMFLGTPQTTFTIYRKLAERNYRPFVWPARYPKKLANYEGLLAPQLAEDIDNGAEAWTVTDPARFSDEDLIEREAAMGRSNFMLQFMLDTTLSDAEKFPLKMADLIVTSVNPTTAPESIIWCSDPQNVIKDAPTVGLPGDYFYSPMQHQGEWDEYSDSICSIDPSGRGTDETAATYISQRNGFLYVHEMRAYRDGYSDNTLLDILRGCRKYKTNKLAPPEDRLLYMLFYQFSRMCREKGAVKHDDRLDSLAQGVKYFTDAMAISANNEIAKRKFEEWKDLEQAWKDDPQSAANHMVLGMTYKQRQEARGKTKNTGYTWIPSR